MREVCRRAWAPISREAAYNGAKSATIPSLADRGGSHFERREHLGFALEAREAIGIESENLRENLERHVAIQLGVARAIDFPHAARANQSDDFVGTQFGSDRKCHALLAR